jgi:hypothetical protein
MSCSVVGCPSSCAGGYIFCETHVVAMRIREYADPRRIHFNGTHRSVQVFSPPRAPGSGWYEVAQFERTEHARLVHDALDHAAPTVIAWSDARRLGEALAIARSDAYQRGLADGRRVEREECAKFTESLSEPIAHAIRRRAR